MWELCCTFLNYAAPSVATQHPSEQSCTLLATLHPSELPHTLIGRLYSAELCCTRWATLHPSEQSCALLSCCTLLSYYVPSGLRLYPNELGCTLEICTVTVDLRCNIWATLYWRVTKLPPFIQFFRMPQCRTDPVSPEPDWQKKYDARTIPVPE